MSVAVLLLPTEHRPLPLAIPPAPEEGAIFTGLHKGCSRQMTGDSDPVNLPALQSDNPNNETREPGDKINAVSLTLAVIGGIILLAITVGSIWE